MNTSPRGGVQAEQSPRSPTRNATVTRLRVATPATVPSKVPKQLINLARSQVVQLQGLGEVVGGDLRAGAFVAEPSVCVLGQVQEGMP
jgi:hypothetical protein